MKKPEEIRKLEERLFVYEGEDRIVSSHELSKAIDPVASTEKTGIPSLDRILGGVEAGEMVIVSGPTGNGKTTFLMSITRNMAWKDIPSVWFTLEVTPTSFIRKIKNACGEKMPLFYMPQKNTENHLQWIEERIIESKVKYNTKVVFIDHIHQIFSLHRMKNANVSLEIGDMVGKIKQIAIEHNLVIFLVAHTRDNAERPNAEPQKELIRDSGLISRLADSIIMVWRVKNTDNIDSKRMPTDLAEDDTQSKVRVVKNRREGRMGTFMMHHNNGLLTEVTLDDYGMES